MDFVYSEKFALEADSKDLLSPFRHEFHLPKQDGNDTLYFVGNSLGLQPISTKEHVFQELENWKERGVEGHFTGDKPWLSYHEQFPKSLGRLIGAKEEEVVASQSLTTNLHLLLCSFYRPKGKRIKILIESPTFPSDRYAIVSQLEMHHLLAEDCLIEIAPREGEYQLRTEDVIEKIDSLGEELALVLFSGVNYYSGQFFDLKAISKASHKVGSLFGCDLAHAIGNVPLQLHDWEVDFAVWCSYKYLNSGPGGVGGYYIHKKHLNKEKFRLAGWWGHNKETRFNMPDQFDPIPTAEGWQLSNVPILSMAAHKASLDLFDQINLETLFKKSKDLTSYLEFILLEINQRFKHSFQIITPPIDRGAQLSILCLNKGKELFQELEKQGIRIDWREPNVIRMAPVPLYNSYLDVYQFGKILEVVLSKLDS